MNKRITWLDAMKGFMIIFVVLCHALVLDKNVGIQGHIDSILMYIIGTFIMPCFFAISGFLYKRTKTWKQYKVLWYKKFTGLAIPYLIFSVLYYLCMKAKQPLYSVLYQPIFLLWFLYALFFIFIIVATMDLLNVPILMQACLYIIAMFAQTKLPWWDGANFDMNPVTCICGYISFFYLGFLLKSYFKKIKFLLYSKLNLIILSIIFIVGLVVQMKHTGIYPFSTDQVSIPDIITKILSVFLFFNFFILLRHYQIHWLEKVGRNTLVIYLTHYFALHFAYVLILQYTVIRSPLIQTSIRFMVGFGSAFVFMWLIKKIKVLNYIFYPRHILDKTML